MVPDPPLPLVEVSRHFKSFRPGFRPPPPAGSSLALSGLVFHTTLLGRTSPRALVWRDRNYCLRPPSPSAQGFEAETESWAADWCCSREVAEAELFPALPRALEGRLFRTLPTENR